VIRFAAPVGPLEPAEGRTIDIDGLQAAERAEAFAEGTAQAVAKPVADRHSEAPLSRSGESDPVPERAAQRQLSQAPFQIDTQSAPDKILIAVELKNGVLRVSVAKRPETQPRKIEVRQG